MAHTRSILRLDGFEIERTHAMISSISNEVSLNNNAKVVFLKRKLW
jgi:hypothetical protein